MLQIFFALHQQVVIFFYVFCGQCLVFHELPFSDDWREFEFAPIITPKYQPTFEQLEIIDRLIDNLDLTKGEKYLALIK